MKVTAVTPLSDFPEAGDRRLLDKAFLRGVLFGLSVDGKLDINKFRLYLMHQLNGVPTFDFKKSNESIKQLKKDLEERGDTDLLDEFFEFFSSEDLKG